MKKFKTETEMTVNSKWQNETDWQCLLIRLSIEQFHFDYCHKHRSFQEKAQHCQKLEEYAILISRGVPKIRTKVLAPPKLQ